MSMTTHVVGIIPADEQYERMKTVYDACTAAKIRAPEEVEEFFNTRGEPEPDGMVTEIPCRVWRGEMSEGVEVVLEEVPESVKVIRFYNAW